MSQTNKRYLCIYLPQWAINIAQRRHKVSCPLLLINRRADQLLVARCCPQAQHQGVRLGMPLPLAKALCPEAQTLRFDATKDFSALRKLSVRALRLAPLVGVDSELERAFKKRMLETISSLHNGLILDITGTEKLHRNERKLCEVILARFSHLAVQARVGIAATIGAAWALSRFGSSSIEIIPPNYSLETALQDLPLEALRVSPETITILYTLGIQSIGALCQLPKKQIALRFGVSVLERVDQALGYVAETFEALEPPEIIRAAHRFETPLLTQESIKIATLFLFQNVFKKLSERKHKAGAFKLQFEGRNNQHERFVRTKEIFLNTATKSFQHVASVLDPTIQHLQIPGGIHAVRVVAYDVEQAYEEQEDFLSPSDLHFLAQSGHEFLNSLVARLGKDKVSSVSFQNSHIPERSFSYEPLERQKQRRSSASRQPRPLSMGRPPYLFRYPEPIAAIAMLPDKAPLKVRWKNAELTICQAVGPERISPEWWQPQPARFSEREYFKLQDQHGRWLWVFRDRSNMHWFVHGLWE